MCKFENRPINISNTSLYTPIVNLGICAFIHLYVSIGNSKQHLQGSEILFGSLPNVHTCIYDTQHKVQPGSLCNYVI